MKKSLNSPLSPSAEQERWSAALSLTRRMPPRLIDRTIAGIVHLCPSLRVELLTRVDRKSKVCFDTEAKKYFVACIYNKCRDSYRSPWTNKYFPLADATSSSKHSSSTSGIADPEAIEETAAPATDEQKMRFFKPSANLRLLEIAYNQLFDAYRHTYYDGGVSSVYLWALPSEDGFAAAFLIHHELDEIDYILADEEGGEGRGCWTSVHVMEVTQTTSNIYYRLTSTVIVNIKQPRQPLSRSSKLQSLATKNTELAGSESDFYAGVMATSVSEQFRKVGVEMSAGTASPVASRTAAHPHIGAIGPMIEEAENHLRTAVERVYLAKAFSVIALSSKENSDFFDAELRDQGQKTAATMQSHAPHLRNSGRLCAKLDPLSTTAALVEKKPPLLQTNSWKQTAAVAAAAAAHVAAVAHVANEPWSSIPKPDEPQGGDTHL